MSDVYLRLTDGTTTVTFSSSPWLGATYFPTQGRYDVTEVTETAVCVVEDTAANVRTQLAYIATLVKNIWQASRIANSRLYVEYKPVDADSAAYRSEVIALAFSVSDEPGRRRLASTLNQVEVAVTWTRRNWWEGAEVELELSTSNLSAATGGRTIYNHDDSGTGHDNWVQIAAAQVTGDLPCAARVELQNTTGSGVAYRQVFMGVNSYADPANFTHIYEAESRLSGGTITADASCSGGNKLDIMITASTLELEWTLSAAQLAKAAGRLCRILLRMADSSGTLYVQPQIQDATATYTLWRGDMVALPSNGGVFDLGTMPLPPGGYSTSYGALTLVLKFTGTCVTALDFVQIMPIDSYRYLDVMAVVANNESIVDNGYEQRAYVLSGASQLPLVAPRGGPLLLQPGKLQRMIVLHKIVAGGVDLAPIANTFSARVWVRPRRLTV